MVGYDRSDDLAVLQLRDAVGLATAALGDSSTVAVNDTIAAIGNAGGEGGAQAAAGTVIALDRSMNASDRLTGSTETLTGLIEVAADVVPGDSGGPLVDQNGRVIGVDTAASESYRYQTSVFRRWVHQPHTACRHGGRGPLALAIVYLPHREPGHPSPNPATVDRSRHQPRPRAIASGLTPTHDATNPRPFAPDPTSTRRGFRVHPCLTNYHPMGRSLTHQR